jgi:hypothetical protein
MRTLRLLPLLIVSLPAVAYETDQLVGRHEPIESGLAIANARVDELLRTAVERTNKKTSCKGSDERTRRVLATEIDKLFSPSTYVSNRGQWEDGLGFGAYTAWLEMSEVDRLTFLDRSDIYGALRPAESVIVSAVGVCSTIELAGVRLGTDKTDHFWAQGYQYERKSKWGKNPEKAVDWGTKTEFGHYGLLTSTVFSFADLHANWRGFQFYQGLLGRESVVQRGEDGCAAVVGRFDWKDWVDDGMDEVLNPSYLPEVVEESVRKRLREDKAAICEGFDTWGVDYEARRERVIHETVNEYTADAPKRVDQLGLVELCAPSTPPDLASSGAPTPTVGAASGAVPVEP